MYDNIVNSESLACDTCEDILNINTYDYKYDNQTLCLLTNAQ